MQKKHAVKFSTGFTLWMLKWRIGDNTQIGVLARHIEQDAKWPLNATDYQAFVTYLDSINADERMKDTLTTAWTTYHNVQKRLNKRESDYRR
jgi:hypothetical protein